MIVPSEAIGVGVCGGGGEARAARATERGAESALSGARRSGRGGRRTDAPTARNAGSVHTRILVWLSLSRQSISIYLICLFITISDALSFLHAYTHFLRSLYSYHVL